MTTSPDDTLLERYADDAAALTAAERAQVEAWLAEAPPVDAATVATVRAHAPTATPPDWHALTERIVQATTARRRTWPWLAGVALAAAAAALVWMAVRPRPVPLGLTSSALVAPAPAPSPVEPNELVDDDLAIADAVVDDDDSDLGGMGSIDDALVDLVLAQEDERNDDDLPAVGATWTEWIDGYSDDELERALAWLETEEAG